MDVRAVSEPTSPIKGFLTLWLKTECTIGEPRGSPPINDYLTLKLVRNLK